MLLLRGSRSHLYLFLVFSFITHYFCRWKHQPTLIKPSDSVSGMSPKRLVRDFRHKQAPGSGSNPFGQNLNNRKVGNITSSQVLSRSNDPPPRKKVKTEHARLQTASGGTYTHHGDWINTRKWLQGGSLSASINYHEFQVPIAVTRVLSCQKLLMSM